MVNKTKRRQKIASSLKKKRNITVIPKPAGSENSNDENAARRAFQQTQILANTTGVNMNLP